MNDPFRTIRETVNALPRYTLAHEPTPLEPLRLRIAGTRARIFVKRDDCTGLALGGNKTRKLEFALGDALALRATALITMGGIQSNHVRQTAAAAARAQLPCHAIVAPVLPEFSRAQLDSGNLLLDQLFGAALHLAPTEADFDAVTASVRSMLIARGERPYIIPLGASNGIGSLGYVRCAWELLEQFREQRLDVSHVFVATGSGGTHGGLLAGLRLAGSAIDVVGISVSDPAHIKREKVTAAMNGVSATLGGIDLGVSGDDLVVHDDYAGAGYSHPTPAANEWIRQVARADGLLLDPVYTGKAFAGMADLLARGACSNVRDVVFLHTGGMPALFADPRLLVQTEQDAAALSALYKAARD